MKRSIANEGRQRSRVIARDAETRMLGSQHTRIHQVRAFSASSETDSSRHADRFNTVVFSLGAACALLMLGWIARYLRRGFDFADEGFYLAWISDPFKYSASITQFGFIYHPLYLLVDGDIALLRQINLVGTFAFAWGLSYVVLGTALAPSFVSRRTRLLASMGMAVGAFVYLRLWLPTPSYNWLAFQALLIGATGLLLAQKGWTRASAIGWTLIAIGGWLAFMAKPTTAAAFSACALIYLIAARKATGKMLCLSLLLSIALLAASAIAIDGSPTEFSGRLRAGFSMATGLGAGHGVLGSFRLDRFEFGGSSGTILLICVVGIAFSTLAQRSTRLLVRFTGWLPPLVALLSIFSIFFGSHYLPDAGDFQHLIVWCVPIAMALITIAAGGWRSVATMTAQQWSSFALLIALPYVFAFGTANNYWWHGGLAGFFYILGGLALISPMALQRHSAEILVPVLVATQLLTAFMVLIGVERPYYQVRPLRESHQAVEIGRHGSDLLLFDELAAYATRAKNAANQAGFVRGTPVIDLSGHSPGLLYAIGASNTAQPWIIGNYPGYTGSEQMARLALWRTSCEELANAWLLTEPEGPVSLHSNLVKVFGADPISDYAIAGAFETTKGVGSFMEIRKQLLLKPSRSPERALSACSAAKTPQ